MGRRGPPPKPTALRRLAGNPSNRPLNAREPRPQRGTPRCPAWLKPKAKAFWKKIVPQLQVMGVLATIDGEALATFCQTWARWREAEEFLSQHGEVYPLRDEQGRVRYMQQFPQVAIARHLAQQLRNYYQEFGMTPSARSRIEVTWGPAADEHETELELLLAQ